MQNRVTILSLLGLNAADASLRQKLGACLVVFAVSVLPYANAQTVQSSAAAAAVQSAPNFVAIPPQLLASPSNKTIFPSSISYLPGPRFMQKFPADDLTMSVTYDYVFTFNLQGIGPAVNAVKVPDGWYALTMAVVAREREGEAGKTSLYNRFVTSNPRMFVRVVNSTVNTEVKLTFADLAATAKLNDLFIELIPLKKVCGKAPCIRLNSSNEADVQNSTLELMPGFSPFLVRMNFVPFVEQGAANPNALELSGAKNPLRGITLEKFAWQAGILKERLRLKSQGKSLTPEQYAQVNHLNYLDLDSPLLAQSSKNQLQSPLAARQMINELFLAKTVGTLRVSKSQTPLFTTFCDVLNTLNVQYKSPATPYPSQGIGRVPLSDWIRHCASSTERRFRISRVTHIGQIDHSKPTPILFNPQLNYWVSAAAIKSRAQSFDVSNSATIRPLSQLFKLFESIGFPGMDASVTVGSTSSSAQMEQGSSTLVDLMDFNPLGVKIPTLNSRVCLQVVFLPKKVEPFYDSRPNAKNGLYICSKNIPKLDVQELYAHIFTRNHDSSIVQAFTEESQPINRSLRGDLQVSGLFWAIRRAVTAEHNNAIFPSQFSQAAETYFSSTPLITPRTVVAPVMFDNEVEPSIQDILLGGFKQSFIEDRTN